MGAMNEAIPDLDGVIRVRIKRAFDSGAEAMTELAIGLFTDSQREQWTKGEIIEALKALRGTKA